LKEALDYIRRGLKYIPRHPLKISSSTFQDHLLYAHGNISEDREEELFQVEMIFRNQ
jgi:hypothetical protein